MHSPLLNASVTMYAAGDGNCGYRAVSLALFSTENLHTYVRLVAALEIVEHPSYYDTTAPQFCVTDQRIATSPYAAVLDIAMHDGKWIEIVHLYAVSAALNVVMQSYLPPSSLDILDSPFTAMIVGRGVRTRPPLFTVMWTSTQIPTAAEPFEVNHLVVLAQRPEHTTSIDSPVFVGNDDDDIQLKDDDGTSAYSAAETPGTDTDQESISTDTASEGGSQQTREPRSVGTDEHDVSDSSVDDTSAARNPVGMQTLPGYNFMTTEQVINLLLHPPEGRYTMHTLCMWTSIT